MLNIKPRDRREVIERINKVFQTHTVRAYMKFVNPGLTALLQELEPELDAKVVIIDSKEDIPAAAKCRNSSGQYLFVFTQNMKADYYFTSVSHFIEVPEAQRIRILEVWSEGQAVIN